MGLAAPFPPFFKRSARVRFALCRPPSVAAGLVFRLAGCDENELTATTTTSSCRSGLTPTSGRLCRPAARLDFIVQKKVAELVVIRVYCYY